MEKAKKITKRENFETLLTLNEVVANPQLVEFIKHEISLLDKKAENRTVAKTANQAENDNIKEIILQILNDTQAKMTITDLQKYSDRLAGYTNQRLSAIVNKLVDTNIVTKTIEKKKSYFSTVA